MTLQATVKSFEPVAAKAYQRLERMIVTLELAPGTITTEGAIITNLGLGRTPVREAVQRLAWEGLIDVRPRTGLAIAPLNRADWLKIMDARQGVEKLLARAAARYAAGPSVIQFHEAALLMEKAVLENNPVQFLDADRFLSELVATTADNSYAARLAAPLQTHSRRFWFRYQAEKDLAHAAEQEVRLIRAILARNEEDAAQEAETLMLLLRNQAEAIARF